MRDLRRPTFSLAALLAPATWIVAGCGSQPLHQDTFFAMGSYVELSIVAPSAESAARAFRAVRAEVGRLDSLLSDYRPDSNVSLLNARRIDTLAPETRHLLEMAQRVCRETDGAFDVSIEPVKRLWGFGATPHLPDRAQVESLLAHVGCEVYALQSDGRLVWLDDEAQLDLGGIAQGLVAARAGELLQAHGIDNYLVDVSGDIACRGLHPSGRPWRIGVQHPRQADSLLARLSLEWAAVTTSGDYEQSFEVNGVRYHHIIDPKTGFPAPGVASVSVFSDDPVAADCYATAVFVLGVERGLRFVEQRADLEALIVEAPTGGDSLHLVSHWSSGLRDEGQLQHTSAAR